MEKMTFTNNQTAFEYALYMMAAGCFDKTVCGSKHLENSMQIQYREQKLDRQYRMENFCIQYLKELEDKLPRGFFRQNMMVFLRKREEVFPTEIMFCNRRYIVRLVGIYNGSESQIRCRIWSRTAKRRGKRSGKAA